jgi:nucleoside-diphosphate-sugar epimerase
MRKLMDSSKARAAGWNPKTSIEEGISKTITWYLSNKVGQ